MASLTTIATVAAIAGTGVSAIGQYQQGVSDQETNEIIALQEEQAGKAEFAAAQRTAQERKREMELVLSGQLAASAASGAGGPSESPTILKLMTETAKRGRYGIETDMFIGKTRKRELERSADTRRRTGRASFLGGMMAAGGTGVSGLGTFANQYHANQNR